MLIEKSFCTPKLRTMKKILTTLMLAIAVFSMAAPSTNKPEKKHRKGTTTATSKKADEKDKTTEAPKKELTPAEKKAKRERTIMENKNEVWNSSNGGGRISYH